MRPNVVIAPAFSGTTASILDVSAYGLWPSYAFRCLKGHVFSHRHLLLCLPLANVGLLCCCRLGMLAA